MKIEGLENYSLIELEKLAKTVTLQDPVIKDWD